MLVSSLHLHSLRQTDGQTGIQTDRPTPFPPSLSSKKTTLISPLTTNSWSVIIGLIIIVAFSGLSWFASPKGENQTVWRSTLILSAWSCYLMWAITFLAQWHPLITPRRSDLRPEVEAGGAAVLGGSAPGVVGF
ncbi:ATP synthase subunit H-domain-containing protein [Phyllosticta citricarpa]